MFNLNKEKEKKDKEAKEFALKMKQRRDEIKKRNEGRRKKHLEILAIDIKESVQKIKEDKKAPRLEPVKLPKVKAALKIEKSQEENEVNDSALNRSVKKSPYYFNDARYEKVAEVKMKYKSNYMEESNRFDDKEMDKLLNEDL